MFRDTGLYVPAVAGDRHWCDLTADIAVIDLRSDKVLDALGVDARASTSYEDHVRRWCHILPGALHRWWGDDVHGIVYDSRTTPSAANVALFPVAPLTGTSTPLADRPDLLAHLVLTAGLQVDIPF